MSLHSLNNDVLLPIVAHLNAKDRYALAAAYRVSFLISGIIFRTVHLTAPSKEADYIIQALEQYPAYGRCFEDLTIHDFEIRSGKQVIADKILGVTTDLQRLIVRRWQASSATDKSRVVASPDYTTLPDYGCDMGPLASSKAPHVQHLELEGHFTGQEISSAMKLTGLESLSATGLVIVEILSTVHDSVLTTSLKRLCLQGSKHRDNICGIMAQDWHFTFKSFQTLIASAPCIEELNIWLPHELNLEKNNQLPLSPSRPVQGQLFSAQLLSQALAPLQKSLRVLTLSDGSHLELENRLDESLNLSSFTRLESLEVAAVCFWASDGFGRNKPHLASLLPDSLVRLQINFDIRSGAFIPSLDAGNVRWLNSLMQATYRWAWLSRLLLDKPTLKFVGLREEWQARESEPAARELVIKSWSPQGRLQELLKSTEVELEANLRFTEP